MELSVDDKIAIVNQHLKTIVGNLYNLNVSLILEQAVEPINEEAVNNINNLIKKEMLKKDALINELDILKNG